MNDETLPIIIIEFLHDFLGFLHFVVRLSFFRNVLPVMSKQFPSCQNACGKESKLHFLNVGIGNG